MVGLEPEREQGRVGEGLRMLQKAVEGLPCMEEEGEAAWLQNMVERVELPCLLPAKYN